MKTHLYSIAAGAVMLLSAGGVLAQSCPQPVMENYRGEWALALTWQPAFCQTYNTKRSPLPKECPTASTMTKMTLHGLWPQWAEYCDESVACNTKNRAAMPKPDISDDLQARLLAVMPGAASNLDRYEYFKHGSCSEMGASAYFEKAIKLVDKLNASSFPGFLTDNVGRNVTKRQMCNAIRNALGDRAVAAVEADAKKVTEADGKRRFYFTELRIWLKADKGGELDLSDAHYLPVKAGAKTLGPVPADPLCDDNLDNHSYYIDVPGMEH